MTNNVVYVLDANVFIEAAKGYYAFDIVPGFWKKLEHYASSGRIKSIDRVLRIELEKVGDQVEQWAKGNFIHAFAPTHDIDVVQSYGQVMQWVYAQGQFGEAHKAKFAKDPDGWLIAYARVRDCVVVTLEKEVPASSSKVKIPNVCRAFNVPFCDTFAMLRALRISFD
jgi:hypothetical protein